MKQFKVGYASVNINPPLGIPISGYYVPRFAKGFLDDLEASALALQLGETKILLISVDNCGINADMTMRFRKAIEAKSGISADSIFLASTHTHTGPMLALRDAFPMEEAMILRYADFLESRLEDLAVLALADVKPARMGFIVGQAPERVAYIRRYKMKDGTTWTCPPINDPNIDHPIGTLDQRVNVLRFDREGAESIVLVNYGVHADTTNGELISSDWVGWLRKTVAQSLDGAKCICFVGAEGDVGSTHVNPCGGDMNDTEISFDNEMKSPGMARFVGRALAGTVLQVYDKAEFIDVDRLEILHQTVRIASNRPTPEDMPRARLYKELHESGRDADIPYTAMELTTVVAEALRMCRMENGPDYFDMDLTGVCIGGVALVGIPGEPFTDIGVQIKDTDGWRVILPCCLVNGSQGYFPMKEAYDEGGYEARTSSFKAGAAETVIEGGKMLLQRLGQ